MTLQDELLTEIEDTRARFLQFLDSIPEAEYSRLSGNEASTVGEELYHVTLGPRAIALEVWMILHARGLFQFGLRYLPARWFNRINAWFARRDTRRFRRAATRLLFFVPWEGVGFPSTPALANRELALADWSVCAASAPARRILLAGCRASTATPD